MVLKIGHRGAMGYEPENTLRSFKKAIELNVDMIEFDVHVCKTGEIVVIHDDKLDRTTNGKGDVSKTSFKELRKLNAGKGEKIPLLQEVLNLLCPTKLIRVKHRAQYTTTTNKLDGSFCCCSIIDKKVKVNIELKGKGTATPVFEVIETYVKENGWSYNDFLISSFNHYELKKFNKLNPKVKISVLTEKISNEVVKFAEKINAYSVNPSIEFVNKKFVDNAHKRGMKVFVWTVNNADDIERMKQLNVDGIFSDFPDRV